MNIDWLAVTGWSVIALGLCCIPTGVICSLLPILPGPPISALAPLLVAAGFVIMGTPLGGWMWALVVITIGIGIVVTVIDAVAPLLGRKLGRSSKSAMVGAYYGLGIGLLFSMQLGGLAGASSLATVGLSILLSAVLGAMLLFLGPLLGGFIGELASMRVELPDPLPPPDEEPPAELPPPAEDEEAAQDEAGSADDESTDALMPPPPTATAPLGRILLRAAWAGIAQGIGLLLTTGAKVAYGTFAGVASLIVLTVVLLANF